MTKEEAEAVVRNLTRNQVCAWIVPLRDGTWTWNATA